MKQETALLNHVPYGNPLMKHAKPWQHLVVSKTIKVTFLSFKNLIDLLWVSVFACMYGIGMNMCVYGVRCLSLLLSTSDSFHGFFFTD